MSIQTVTSRYDRRMYFPIFREYFNQSGFFNYGYWYEDTANPQAACENLVEKLLAYLPARTGTILDVACGMGATTRHLLKYYSAPDVVGINISAKQLESSRVNAPGCSFCLMDAPKLGFGDSAFDNMICVEAVFHFNTREQFLRDACRVLKPGGFLVLSDIMFSHLAHRTSKQVPAANYVKTTEQYKQLYLRAGFQEVEVVDALDNVLGGFRRYMLRWRREKFRTGELSALGFARYLIAFLFGRTQAKHYYLVAAKKG